MSKGLIEKKLFIIDHIRKFSPVSRHIISRRFHMNQATVGNIINPLIKDGIVIESPILSTEERNIGRPPVGLRLNPNAGYFIGIDMYDRQLTAVLTDFECNPVCEYHNTFKKNDSSAVIIDTVKQSIDSLLNTSGKPKSKLKGIGIGLPGRINLKEGIAVEYHRIPNWGNLSFGPVLQKAYKTPVFVEHNSSMVSLAQAWKNSQDTSGIVAGILVRTGVSLGIVQNREIINSSTYSAGELGHTVINFNGPKCRCGNKGCLETYASGAALKRIVSETAEKHSDWPGSAALKNGTLDSDLICELAASGDKLSRKILQTMFRHLCVGIDTVMKLYAPDIIAINGIFNRASALLMDAVNQYCSQSLQKQTQVIIEPYDSKSGALGAAFLAATYTCNPVYSLPGQPAHLSPTAP